MRRIRLIKLDEEISDEGVYSEDSRNTFVEEDELSSIEAAFMKGWEEAA